VVWEKLFMGQLHFPSSNSGTYAADTERDALFEIVGTVHAGRRAVKFAGCAKACVRLSSKVELLVTQTISETQVAQDVLHKTQAPLLPSSVITR
jgi:hypothetical protein